MRGRLRSWETHKKAFSQVPTLSCFPALDTHLGSSCSTAAGAIKSHNSETMANKVELFGHPHAHTSTILHPVFVLKKCDKKAFLPFMFKNCHFWTNSIIFVLILLISGIVFPARERNTAWTGHQSIAGKLYTVQHVGNLFSASKKVT